MNTSSSVRMCNASRALALACLLGLVAVGLSWELWLAPTGSGTLALKVLPLLAALPGIWRARLYTYRWLSLLVWVYVAESLVRATTERGLSAWLAALQLVLCLLLFTACAMRVRSQRSLRSLASLQKAAP